MSDRNRPAEYTFKENWRQPLSLLNMMTGTKTESIIKLDTSLGKTGKWNINYEACSPTYVYGQEKAAKSLYRHLDPEQKDKIIAGIHYDEAFAVHYAGESPGAAFNYNVIETDKNDGSVPKLMRTKTVLIPANIIRSGAIDVKKQEGRIFDYTARKIDPFNFLPRYMDDVQVKSLCTRIDDSKQDFCPVQFFARHYMGVYDAPKRHFKLNNSVAGYYAEYYKENFEKRAEKECSPSSDVWTIECGQLGKPFLVDVSVDPQFILNKLELYEKEFIDPGYERDKKLHQTHELMKRNYGPDPLHYSQVDQVKLRTFQNNRKILTYN